MNLSSGHLPTYKARFPVLTTQTTCKTSLELGRWGYVLENGRIVLSGDAKEILKSDQI